MRGSPITLRPSPTLSPDGRKIAFQTGRAGNRPAIVVINRDGTGLHQIAPLGEHPVWSPDGTKIAFSIWRNTKQKPYYTRRIYVVRADGTNRHRLKPSGLYPAWSPDGTKIAYACGPLRGRYDASLCVMKANGTGQHRIARIGSLGTPAWSPDGSKIAFYSGNEWLYVINANATHLRQLKAVSSLFECTPAWSPNGKRIAFSNTNGGPWLITNGIFLIDADGRNIVHLKGTTGGCGIHWQRTH